MDQARVKQIFDENTDILKLPIRIEKSNMLNETLFSRWEKYIKMLNSTPELKDCVPYAQKSKQLLKSALKSYYAMRYSNAQNEMSTLVKLLTKRAKNSHLITDLDSLFIDEESKQWFRARIDSGRTLTKRDMKHVPANERSKVKNFRYSINGIPCLYIANSIQCCWEECGRPPVDSFWVCRYRPTNTIKILNLSTTGYEIINAHGFLRYVVNNTESYDEAVLEFFSNWILQSACSVIVENDEGGFKPEYVIPQLLMQSIKSIKVDGIMYFSTRVNSNYNTSASWIAKNIAIPAFDATEFNVKNGLYSKKIDSLFVNSSPINVGFFAQGIIPSKYITYHESQNIARSFAPAFYTSFGTNYNTTPFYKCEIELQNYFD